MLQEEMVIASFGKVKRDMDGHMQLIEELREENSLLRQKIEALSAQSITHIDPHMIEDTLRKIIAEKKRQSNEVTIKIDKHSRKAIKDEMLSMVESKQTTLADLKERIVDINKYCSKATFYRYYEELRLDNLLEEDNESRQKFLKSKRKIEVSFI